MNDVSERNKNERLERLCLLMNRVFGAGNQGFTILDGVLNVRRGEAEPEAYPEAYPETAAVFGLQRYAAIQQFVVNEIRVVTHPLAGIGPSTPNRKEPKLLSIEPGEE